jgi:hypothetical protein
MKSTHLGHALSISMLLVAGTAVAQSPSGGELEIAASAAPASPPASAQFQAAQPAVTA